MEVVNSEAIKALPPGPATDRDIALVREPFPTARANGEYIANWLGAVARLNEKRAQYAEHKAQFIAQNGGQRNAQGETVLSSWKRIQSEQAPAAPAASRFKIGGAVMPTYQVTDPASGRTLRLTGDSPPTDAELEQIFAEYGAERAFCAIS